MKDSSGNLYGTTVGGGAPVYGTVFKLTPSSASATGYAETVLHSFSSSDGAFPTAALVVDNSGNLYGTTFEGGSSHFGTVFKLTPSPGSATGYAETVLYSFTGGSDGSDPFAGLILDSSGNLYGTALGGGYGTVFKLTPSPGSATGYAEAVLYRFTGGTDGSDPVAGLTMDSNGNLYGATDSGGASGYGTVFKLTPSPGSATGYAETVLYSFTGASDGASPKARLITDAVGNLYGTTFQGGASGYGTVFELAKSNGTYTETVLHAFTNTNGDGAYPEAGLVVDSSGSFYGATDRGGAYGYGTVFRLTPPSNTTSGYAETVLHSFSFSDGAYPVAGLLMNTSDKLYGITDNGGSSNGGTAFEISLANTPAGSNISVQPTDSTAGTSPVSLTFSSITQAGSTTLTTSSSGPAVPQDFKLGTPATYYNLATTATYSGSITICINYSGVSFHNPSQLSIWHYDTAAAAWTQLTTTVDQSTTTACAVTPSLSPFALLEPAYAAQIQPPIGSDGSSVFSANRGVVPVKFTLTYGGNSTCQLPQATISLIRTAGGTLGSVDQDVYASPADTGSYFRIDTSACQYVYNLDSGSLGSGTYQADISIDGSAVGSGTFGLK